MMDKNFAFPFWKLSAFMYRNQNLRKFNLFNIGSRCRKCPSARCASAAEGISGNMALFSGNMAVFSGNMDVFSGNMDVFMGKSLLFNGFEIN